MYVYVAIFFVSLMGWGERIEAVNSGVLSGVEGD